MEGRSTVKKILRWGIIEVKLHCSYFVVYSDTQEVFKKLECLYRGSLFLIFTI